MKPKKTVKPALPRRNKFLVYIDDGEYSKKALWFACGRAAREPKRPVEMLYVLEPVDFSSLGGVEEIMRKERREKAEQVLHHLAGEANDFAGLTPSLRVKEGQPEDQILAALRNDKDIGILVLGTAADGKGDNKMLSWLVSHIGKSPVPIMIVPGSLTKAQIKELT